MHHGISFAGPLNFFKKILCYLAYWEASKTVHNKNKKQLQYREQLRKLQGSSKQRTNKTDLGEEKEKLSPQRSRKWEFLGFCKKSRQIRSQPDS